MLYTLSCAGYGWLRPAGVRRELERMARKQRPELETPGYIHKSRLTLAGRALAVRICLPPKCCNNMAQKFDPVTLEILWRRLLSMLVASRESYRLTEEEVKVVEGRK